MHRISAIGILSLSLFALATILVGAALALFGPTNPYREADEGTLAHLFQLSMVLLAPTGLLYLVTADWNRPSRAGKPLAVSGAAVVLAFALLFYFERG